MKEGFVRNFVFGIEDSLVSTVGFISGIAYSNIERKTIILSGLVLIAVEAFSMAVGSFLSDQSVRQWRLKSPSAGRLSLFGAVVMFLSYALAGGLVLAPYLLVGPEALGLSVIISLAALFCLGIFSAVIAGLPVIQQGLRMALVGGLAVGVGVLVSTNFN